MSVWLSLNVPVLPPDFDVNNRDHRMIRLYVGREDTDYLIKDLEQALEEMEM
ncbi:MAG: hypothetical protein H7296_11700 [Bacteroidia bacterium]|nr:hypothetical protein [Bacteroidia bacterium]